MRQPSSFSSRLCCVFVLYVVVVGFLSHNSWAFLSSSSSSSSTTTTTTSPLVSFSATTASALSAVPEKLTTTPTAAATATAATTMSETSTDRSRGYQASYLPKVLVETDSQARTSEITFEDIAKYPGRAFLSRAGAPTKIEFGPDNNNNNNDDDSEDATKETTSLIYLGGDSGGLTQKLWKRTWSTKNGNADADTIVELAQPPTGIGEEGTLSAEEKLRRERTRQLTTGITNFEYSQNKKVILIPIGNDLYIQRAGEQDLIQIVDSTTVPGSVIDPHISKDGSIVVFVCEKELYMVPTTTTTTTSSTEEGHPIATPVQLTFDARGTEGTVNGLADFIAMEELERYEGYWISPDTQYVAFEQSDESHIPKFRIMHSGQASPTVQEDHHYPFAGEANPKMKIGILPLSGEDGVASHVNYLDLDSIFNTEDIYLARVDWGKARTGTDTSANVPPFMYVQVMNRAQTELVLLRYDLTTTKLSELFRETAPAESWVNLNNNFIPLSDGGFIWGSERNTGYNHLYRYDSDGKNCIPLTSDPTNDNNSNAWMVETCTSDMVDEDNDLIYFTGTKDSPKESHLYCTSLLGLLSSGKVSIDRMTSTDGMHSILAIDTKRKLFVDSWSSVAQPHQVAVRSLEVASESSTPIVRVLHDGTKIDPKVQDLRLVPPEFFEVRSETSNENSSSEQKQILYGAFYKPDPKKYGPGPYPTVVSVYGGPHAQMVTDTYGMTADLRAQRLRSQGYAVMKLDNRGSGRRGLSFETPIYYDMGNLEVDDQIAGLQHWIEKGVVDPKRIGIYGWSYGGYMSGMCLAKRPDIFKVAVAGAMVSSWDGYDTCYTERYMGTPTSNAEGYQRSDVMPYADNINGSLLLVHGLIDENVHFRHTARFVNALIKARKYYELLLFPDERHVPRGLDDKVFMEERIASFIERTL